MENSFNPNSLVKAFQQIYGVSSKPLGGGKYLPYGFGELYDAFPQFLIFVSKNSGSLNNAITKKANLVRGFGFEHDWNIDQSIRANNDTIKVLSNSELTYETKLEIVRLEQKNKMLSLKKIGNKEINSKGHTLDFLLEQTCLDMIRFEGFAWHLNYNAMSQISSINHLDFEKIRVGEPDEEGCIKKIAIVHRYDKYFSKKYLKLVEWFDSYNSDKNAIQKSIRDEGISIENKLNWKGQILYHFEPKSGARYYPYPCYCPILQDAENEYSISVSKKTDIEESFKGTLVITKFGNKNPTDDERLNDIKTYSRGSSPDGPRTYIEYAQNKESAPEYTTISPMDTSKLYEYIENSIQKNIKTQFDIPEEFYSFTGKSDFLGDSDKLKKLLDLVQKTVLMPIQNKIVRIFEKVFSNYTEDINPSGNWNIKNLTIE